MTDNIQQENTTIDTSNNTADNNTNSTATNTLLSTTNTQTIETNIPEKFKVTAEDGSVDYKATVAKLSESYSGLEKRVGTGDLPPKTAEEYKIEREGFDFEEFKKDESNNSFLKSAHAQGITNKQLDFLLSEYDARAVNLVSNSSQIDTDTVVQTLQSEWGSNYQANIFNAVKAAKACGITEEQINDPSIGNNVAFIKMASYFGSQLSEDNPINNISPVKEDVISLMKSEAYSDKRHPDHEATVAKVNQAYANGFKLTR